MNTVTNIVTISEKEWPAPSHFGIGLAVGFVVLFVLYWLVRLVMCGLRHRAGTSKEPAAVERIAFSTTFAAVEQFLFYLAAIAGLEVFGFAVGGWLVMKSVCQYARWKVPDPPHDDPKAAALAHNRFLIFILGSGMSIAAGGIAGVAYHYTLFQLGL